MKAVRQISTGEIVYREHEASNYENWVGNASGYRNIPESDLEIVDATPQEIANIGKPERDKNTYRKMVHDKLQENAFNDLISTGKIPSKIKYKDLF